MNKETEKAPALLEEGQAPGLGEKCTCPLCGQDAPAEVLRGQKTTWWIYKINHVIASLKRDPDLEGAMDIEFDVVRR